MWRWIAIGAITALGALAGGIAIHETFFGECGMSAPKVVEFHQGMTLCPGQSATLTMPLAVPLHR